MDVSKRPGLMLWLACGATFLAYLDVTVVNLAIPDLLRDFRSAQVTDVAWVITLYATAFAALLAPAGRLADVVGRRVLFASGIGLFGAMSLLCSVSPNLMTLLIARTVQGAAAAVMIPTALAIVLVDTPAARRARSIGLWSASAALAATLGPALGGVLVDAYGWRSVFIINVPITAVLLVGARAVPVSRIGLAGRLPDVVGAGLLAVAVGLAVLGVTEGRTWHWTSIPTITTLIGAVAALGAALWRSRWHPAPAIEIGLWRSRTFAWANAASVLFGLSMFSWMLCSVLFLTEIWGYRELVAGFAVSLPAVAATIGAIGSGRLTSRYGPRVAVVAGGILVAGGALLFALTIPRQPGFLVYFLPAAVIGGIGMGMVTTGLSSAAALSVQPARFASATGLNQTARQVGGALGVALLAAILVGDPGSGSRLDAYRTAFAICAVAALGSAICGLMLSRPARPAPAAIPVATAGQAVSPTR
jgi:EmrB/QacA subfamily drug resistance transporter